MPDRRELQEKQKTYLARSDVFQEEDRIQLVLEMPGVEKDNLEVRIENDLLIIHGKKKVRPTDGEYRVHEIVVGDFHNEYTIDNTVDRDRIDASISNGIVTIDLNIKESEKPRTIKIVSK